jgi:hypothetical protein
MKEQTRITAEEFLDKDEFVNVKGFIKESGTLKTTTSLMEQYAQTKVLEALENKYSRDDIIHALAYGYKGANSYLTHSEVLKRYKESNMKQK